MTANPSVANEGDAALFNTVVFALDPAIPYAVKTHACRALIEAGAIEADSWNQANIVIAISLDFEGKNRLAEGTSIVTVSRPTGYVRESRPELFVRVVRASPFGLSILSLIRRKWSE